MGRSKTEIYLEQAGQTWEYLMSGEETFGLAFILYLVDRCINENKKIVWQYEPGDPKATYSLVSVA